MYYFNKTLRNYTRATMQDKINELYELIYDKNDITEDKQIADGCKCWTGVKKKIVKKHLKK